MISLQTTVSICTSWLSIGMGLKGIVLLKDFFLYYQAEKEDHSASSTAGW